MFRAHRPTSRHYSRKVFPLLVALLLSVASVSYAQTKRLIVIQHDGLAYAEVDRFARQRDPKTGKSLLPWIDHIFYQRGTRLENFYVRGMSLSAPSWSLINTGQHLQIKGNVEFDRMTLQTYDYLNFIPFYVKATIGERIDMQGTEILDSIGIPLLSDAYPRAERYTTLTLFQRGPRYTMFQKALGNTVKRSPRELFDEWTLGLSLKDSIPRQIVNEAIEAAGNPKIKYVEFLMAEFDHVAHHNNDRESHLSVLRDFDATLGQIWTAIQKSPAAGETALIVVSDHGSNSVDGIYSQGFNLVRLLGSVEGGGHHVVTKRRLMADYSLKSMNPFIQVITTTSRDSYYLKGKSTEFPTAMLDFDGNERASIHLRDSDLNLLQILLQQLQGKALSAAQRKAATNQFFLTIDRRRSQLQKQIEEVKEELGALHRTIERQQEKCAAQPKKFTPEEHTAGGPGDAKRVCVQADIWLGQEKHYTEYVRVISNLLALKKETFDPAKIDAKDIIGARLMGKKNSIYQLQNYIVGLSPTGIALSPDGSLDVSKSLKRVNYLSLLRDTTVRNNVQPRVSNRPVDMILMRLPAELFSGSVSTEQSIEPDVIWIYRGTDRQALILSKRDSNGLSFRYLPIKNLQQDETGKIQFENADWDKGFPLEILEDPNFAIPAENRESWLSEWHSELDWFHALHRTHYSNGLIGVHEELARHNIGRLLLDEATSSDERLMRRLLRRQRENIETDMLVMASDHWNFDVRGFNPGGNHGSFFRNSTHSTFMIAGGDHTGIPRGQGVAEPYDSLSFVPTVLALTGNLREDSSPIQVLWDKGFRRFPGRPVKEIVNTPAVPKIADTRATASH